MLVLKKKDIYFTIELSLMVISFVKLYAHEQLYPFKEVLSKSYNLLLYL